MRIKLLVDNPRLNEMSGVLILLLAIGLLLCLVSYSPADRSFNVATFEERATNWMGLPGSYGADLILQSLGLVGFLLPAWLSYVAWHRIRSLPLEYLWLRLSGGTLLALVICCSLQMASLPLEAVMPARWDSTVRPGGALGKVLADASISVLNIGGTILLVLACTLVSLYMLTTLRVSDLFRRRESGEPGDQAGAPLAASEGVAGEEATVVPVAERTHASHEPQTVAGMPQRGSEEPPWDKHEGDDPSQAAPPVVPFRGSGDDSTLEGTLSGSLPGADRTGPSGSMYGSRSTPEFRLPPATLLNPPLPKQPYEEQQLQATAQQIVAKFEEFGVRGSVSQINPGPVVTTFEFKPDRGIRLSRIVNLSEDLCLALKCESVLVERIPGKSTVGVEVPNKRREIIALREVVDSQAFEGSRSMLNFALGKDVNGRLHCADLAGMPHLLVAGQTGSGKSVMVNCVIMSILLRATPDDVRLILVDPKTVELGLYRDVPHLLTPVITDTKKATNALKNATQEMDRRLQLLAKHGVRNIAQFNQKVERASSHSQSGETDPELRKLPYIVVIVDELADLMMIAGRQVEASIQRLAQMSRAVGIHLILATQRPSVDVITGLIKANIPARLSFVLATRVDSRTILDSMGAEALLGKGDMLFLPPGTSRRRRLHGPLVTEEEIEAVVSHWKDQAKPAYENEYLESTDGDGDQSGANDDAGFDDPKYKEAVQLVIEMGKASTSTLQRRLRLGYGRAARILDAMERDGIIGPQDGSLAGRGGGGVTPGSPPARDRNGPARRVPTEGPGWREAPSRQGYSSKGSAARPDSYSSQRGACPAPLKSLGVHRVGGGLRQMTRERAPVAEPQDSARAQLKRQVAEGMPVDIPIPHRRLLGLGDINRKIIPPVH